MRKLACLPAINLLVTILTCLNARAGSHGNLTLSLTTVDPTCQNNNGSIIATAANGTPPYKYSLNGGPFKTQNSWLYQGPGNYTVIAKDANGLTASSVVVLTNHFNRPQGQYVSETPTTACPATDGTLTVNVQGGTPPYLFSLDLINYQQSNVFTNLAAGWYVAYAKDANGCLASISTYPLGLTCFTFASVGGGSTCGSGGTVEISQVGGGVAPYTFSEDGINYQKSGKFNDLHAGVNLIYIKDAAGTIYVHGFQVDDYCPVQLSISSQNATCGNNDGSVNALASNGTEPYQYSVDGINFQAGGTFNNLTPGDYTVSVKDATGRVVKKEVAINSGCLMAAVSIHNAACGDNNGSLKVTPTNGTLPYQYSLDGNNFQTSDSFPNLAPGNYIITVKDAAGVTATTSAAVKNIPGPSATISVTNAGCDMNNGTLIITPVGGTLPFEYSLDSTNFFTDSVFGNLSPGNYTGYLADSNKCTFQLGVFSIYNLCLDFDVVINSSSCNQSSGSLTVVVTRGTAPYLYSLDGKNFQSNNIFMQLPPGNYNVTVKDNAGVIKTQTVQISQSCINVIADATSTTCKQDNGKLTIHASNGTAPYNYALNGAGFQADSIFSNLAPGTYSVTVKDATGASRSAQANVADVFPPVLKTTVTNSSCADDDGSITVSATGGTAPYMFSLDNGAFTGTSIFNHLAVNNYAVMVQDADGCLSQSSVRVPLYNDLYVDAGRDTSICGGTAIKLFAVSNGSSFAWSPSTDLTGASSPDPEVSPVSTSTYYVTASTAVCSAVDSVTVYVNPAPVANAGIDTSICYGNSTMLSGSGGIKYAWLPPLYLSDPNRGDPTVVKPKQTIAYHLTVVGINGCSSVNDAFVTVRVTPVARVFAGNDTNAVMNQPLQLQAKDIDHAGFISYVWSPAYGLNNPLTASPEAILNNDITYSVVASTATGCEATDQVTVKVYHGPDIYVPSAFTPNNDGLNDLLKPVPVGIRDFLFFKVFDRWGNLVFYTSDYRKGWTGSVKGFQPSQNTYVWIAAGKDTNGNLIQRKGTVTIIF